MAKAIAPFTTEDHSIPSKDGESSLFIRHYSRKNPQNHFLIVHGAVEHSGRHMDLVHFLLKNYNDVAVTVFDHLGHGRSGGTRAHVDSFNDYIEDFKKVFDFVLTKNHQTTKTFICAHSLGGLITLTALLDSSHEFQAPIKGLIFSSPCIRPQTLLAPLVLPLLDKLNLIMPKLHLPLIYKGAELTRDSARANDFDTDPLIPKFISVRMAKEVLDASNKIIGLSYYLRVPSLFLVAGDDKIVDPESTVLFAHGIEKKLTEIIKYPDHRHELWNETNREEIFVTMKKWIDKELKESP